MRAGATTESVVGRPLDTAIRGALTLVILAGAAASTTTARAQTEPSERDEEAHVLFEAGRLAFNEGHYEDAYERYAEAYRLSERPELLYNMASAADRLRRDALALEHYRAFLDAMPDAPQRLDVEQRIAILEGGASDDRPPVMVVAPTPAPDAASAAAAPHDAPIWEQWWLWTVVGVVVVGAGVGIGVGVATASSASAHLVPGDVGPGGVVLALSTSF